MKDTTINHGYFYEPYTENENYGFPSKGTCAVGIGYMGDERATNRSQIAF
jgi:hypothetical protein